MAIQEDASDLPNDILENILSRLPVKSLLRFTSVSRSWNTMISDPRFVQIHHQQSMYSDSQNLFLLESGKGFSLVRLEGLKFKTEAVLESPHGLDYVLCIGDGVVLLGDVCLDCRTYLLWNPCSRQETMFRYPYMLTSLCYKYRICPDPSNDDFKVVFASENFYAIFSCKNKSWTKKKELPYSIGYDSGISTDGAIYWVWHDGDETYRNKYTYRILYFDPRDDNFKILQKPENVKDNVEFFLTRLKGCLCLYCYGRDETTVQIWVKEKGGPYRNSWKVLMNIENLQTPTVQIWVKEKGGPDRNSWKVLMNIENLQTPVKSLKLLPLTENKILIDLDGKKFLFYNRTETFEEFKDEFYAQLHPCLDSLFFPAMKTRPKRKRSTNYSQFEY